MRQINVSTQDTNGEWNEENIQIKNIFAFGVANSGKKCQQKQTRHLFGIKVLFKLLTVCDFLV